MFYFPADGAPLSELSWSSSLAVVAVSFSGLFTVIVLMLACLCCKKGGIGFKVRREQDPPTTRLPFIQGLPWDPLSLSSGIPQSLFWGLLGPYPLSSI